MLLLLCATAAATQRVTRVVVYKAAHEMVLLNGTKELKRYKIALGNAKGNKVKRGDRKTPEGVYKLDFRNPKSQFYRSIHISYPSAADRERAHKAGVDPGGDIFIHGLGTQYGWVGAAHRARDWTNGCIAVTNEEMDEIWAMVANGTEIEIVP